MANLRILSSAEQVAAYLRRGLSNRVWTGLMPGGDKLAREMGVGTNTMESALKILESEGWLINQGRRRGRLIQPKQEKSEQTRMRVCILLGDTADRHQPYIIQLSNALEERGHLVTFAAKSQEELGDDAERVAALVEETPADVWIACSSSQDVLKWFAESGKACFALAGRSDMVKVPCVAPDKITPLRDVLRQMVGLGHKRIVLMCRPMRRIPEPGLFERAFLDELENLGIATSQYNLPDWDEGIGSFHRCLDSLFRVTPPTAMLIDESIFVPPTLQFCMRAGLKIPEDFSLICTDPDPSFSWCEPTIAHIRWDSFPMSRRIVKWIDKLARGKEDHRKRFYKAEFIHGGSVGPAPK